MSTTVTATFSVAERAIALGFTPPTHLTVLPRNFESAHARSDLVHEALTATIRKLWREAGVQETPLEPAGEKFPRMQERSADWIAPTLFVGSMLLSENPHAVSLAIEIIKEYVVDFFKGSPNVPTVTLNVIVETTAAKQYREISYSGPAEGLSELPDIIKEAAKANDQ